MLAVETLLATSVDATKPRLYVISAAISREYLSTQTSAGLRSARRTCIVPDSGSGRNEGKAPGNRRDRLPSAAAPARPALGEHLPAEAPLRDSTQSRPPLL